MQIRSRGTWLVIAALVLVACQGGLQKRTPAEPVVDTDAEVAAIMALEREWLERFQEKDLEWILSLQAQNARLMPSNAEPVVGDEALHRNVDHQHAGRRDPREVPRGLGARGRRVEGGRGHVQPQSVDAGRISMPDIEPAACSTCAEKP
jgi:hypothetical protein